MTWVDDFLDGKIKVIELKNEELVKI